MADIIEEIVKTEENTTNIQKQSCKSLIENYKKENPDWEKQKEKIKENYMAFKKQQNCFNPTLFAQTSNNQKMEAAIDFFTSLYNEANSLMQKNQELKDYAEKRSNEEIFALKNQEIEMLRAKILKLEGELCKHLTLKEVEAVNQWYTKHSRQIPNCSHKIHLEYFETHLDPGIEVSCSCGQKYYIWR